MEVKGTKILYQEGFNRPIQIILCSFHKKMHFLFFHSMIDI